MPLQIVYEVEDASGDKASTEIKVGGNQVLTNVTDFAATYATAMNNIIRGIIRSAIAYLFPDISGLIGNVATTTSDVEHIGKFEFIAINGIRVKVNIPAIDEQLVEATSSDSINQSEVNVAAFLAAMETGIAVSGGVTIAPCDIGESSISDTVFAREAFRNSGARR